jgi:hypothetical protein
MSNKAYIQQETTIVHKTKKSSKSVSVYDSHGQGSISLDKFYEDDMELLVFLLEAVKGGGLDNVNDVLDSVYANKRGMVIEDIWYDWEQIETVFEKSIKE